METKEEMKQVIKDLRFNFSNDMFNTMLQMLTIQQMLEDFSPCKKDRKLLEKKFKQLQNHFIKEFQARNLIQIKIYRSFLNLSENQK